MTGLKEAVLVVKYCTVLICYKGHQTFDTKLEVFLNTYGKLITILQIYDRVSEDADIVKLRSNFKYW
ncbi:hypothetical protein Hamer_G022624 [Homarus americanus]|uniref:Uncharacterized protein n=1 Tax=Homarus americanus TaxID=6706 RepID=A0A8J5JRC9_HOMAM|nr:hypothetical protein Hamer_G022624 [Homarus americanus]